ncbi:Protein of unknown function [Thalassovita litoralis]|uniref:DUF1638 domain-containing protein n=1 Tax=Thalassovita litoralis TaxID=1010611 RepID=A0A521CWD8_9RHOB|nr:DUF1638 domain-containing protein [Thalassovita litoralis]SMO63765.1 Protein of unknown function [Thalassovita litoralis]
MTLPSDDSLTRNGLAPAHETGRVLLIACGALAREILALIRLNGWSHMDLTCLPAILHNHPEKIAAAVEQTILEHQATHDRLFVVYADCGTGGMLEQVCTRHGVEMIAGPHCYSFYEGNAAFAEHGDEITAFYLTDFLTRQFDAFVWKPLGLDRHPELLPAYFGHYTKLVYQAQTDDPALTTKAQECAARLGLSFERRFTGYGDLATALAKQA